MPCAEIMSSFTVRKPFSTSSTFFARFRFILTLSFFSLVGYVLRMNISVAAVFLVAELHLTTLQLGQIFSSFLIGYTIFQLPWGLFGDRFGARPVLCIAAVTWGITSLFTGLLPGLVLKAGITSFLALLTLRFLLGVGEAAGFPVAARAIASSMPKTQHGLGYSAVIAGTAAGSALTPPLISRLMVSVGWRASFYITSCVRIRSCCNLEHRYSQSFIYYFRNFDPFLRTDLFIVASVAANACNVEFVSQLFL